MSGTQQLIEVEEKPSLSIKLGNPAVLQRLRVFGDETNSETHEKGSVIVSLIGKQKTYKSTHANLLFGTSFPKGMLGMQQTTKGILIESCLISTNSKKANLHCLDYEGFGSTGRNLTSEEEKALDNKLMLLAYSISNIVIFSMHAADLSPFREFVQLMKMCVKGIKTNDETKKPTLLIFVNVSLGDKNTILMNALNSGFGKTPDEIREGIHGFASQSLLAQNDFQECKLYFSEVIVQTLYPNQMGNETEGFILNHLKTLLYDKTFSSELQDSPILFNEERWKNTVNSINSNEQIEFASDVLGRLSETTCSNKCEFLKKEFDLQGPKQNSIADFTNLKSNLIVEYWKEAKGKHAQQYAKILNDYFESVSTTLSPKILINQINQIVREFKTEMTTLISKDGLTNLKLKNFRSNFIEKWEYEFSMQEFMRLTSKIDMIYNELMEEYSISKMSEIENQLKSLLKKENINFTELQYLIDETKETLLSFQMENSSRIIKWYERNESFISSKKLELDSLQMQSSQKNKQVIEMKMSFLDSLTQVTRLDQMDFLLKRYLLNLESNSFEEKQVIECEKFFRQSHEDYLAKSLIPNLLNEIEIEFKNSLNTVTTLQSLDELYQSTTKKYTHPQTALTIESINKLKQQYGKFRNEKGKTLYSSEKFKEASEWVDYSDQKDVDFQLFLGDIYQNGKYNISQNNKIAFQWFEKSANQGNQDAMFQLAKYYDYAHDAIVSQDRQKAFQLYERAANQGHAKSQYLLGIMYRFGNSDEFPHVDRNDTKAVEWLEKAANQGNSSLGFKLFLQPSNDNETKKTEQCIEKISELSQIEQLSLARCNHKLTSIDLKLICSMKKLTYLDISGNNIGDEGTKHISKLINLRNLNIYSNSIGVEGATQISKLNNLTNLKIHGNRIGVEGSKQISKLINLTNLDISCNNIGAEGSKEISKLIDLTNLNISYNYIGVEGAKEISKLINLTNLNISDNKIGVEGIKNISKLINLTNLNISNNNISIEGAKEISKLNNLTNLNIYNTNIGVEGTKLIFKLINLTNLNICFNKIGNEGVKEISKLNNLTNLNISYNNIDVEGANEICKLTDLTNLDISFNKIGEGTKYISKLINLTNLNISNNTIGDKGAKEISKLINLTSLKIHDNNIGAEGKKHISKLNLKQITY